MLAKLDELHGDTSFNGNAVFGDDAAYDVLIDENGEAVVVEGESVSAEALGLDGVSLADGASARDALASMSDARDSLAAARSSYSGSAVSLRESRNHVANKASSLSAANSRIIDADFARESTELVRIRSSPKFMRSALWETRRSPSRSDLVLSALCQQNLFTRAAE